MFPGEHHFDSGSRSLGTLELGVESRAASVPRRSVFKTTDGQGHILATESEAIIQSHSQ